VRSATIVKSRIVTSAFRSCSPTKQKDNVRQILGVRLSRQDRESLIDGKFLYNTTQVGGRKGRPGQRDASRALSGRWVGCEPRPQPPGLCGERISDPAIGRLWAQSATTLSSSPVRPRRSHCVRPTDVLGDETLVSLATIENTFRRLLGRLRPAVESKLRGSRRVRRIVMQANMDGGPPGMAIVPTSFMTACVAFGPQGCRAVSAISKSDHSFLRPAFWS
jgi:hypothetical protein